MQYPNMMMPPPTTDKKKKKKKKSSSSDDGAKAAKAGICAAGCCCLTIILVPIVICIIIIIIIIVAVSAAGDSIESIGDAIEEANKCDPKCTYLEDWSTVLDCDPGNDCQCPGASTCSFLRICSGDSETPTCKQFGQENMLSIFDDKNKQ